jgi:hypothetical protein
MIAATGAAHHLARLEAGVGRMYVSAGLGLKGAAKTQHGQRDDQKRFLVSGHTKGILKFLTLAPLSMPDVT